MSWPTAPQRESDELPLAEVIAWFALYFLLGAASLYFLRKAISTVIPVWLPCGIGIALQVRAAPRQRVPLAVAQMLVEFVIEESFGVLPAHGLHVIYALSVGIEAYLAGAAMRWLNDGREVRLISLRDLRAFLGGIVIATFVGGSLASFAEIWYFDERWYEGMAQWIQSDLSGMVVLAPLALADDPHEASRFRARWRDGVLQLLVLMATVVALYGTPLTTKSFWVGLGVLMFPPLIWSALTFGVGGAAAGSVLLSITVGLLTELGYGPVAALGFDQFTRQLLSQGFVALVAVSALTVGVLTRSQWRSHASLLAARNAAEDAAARFRAFFEGTPEMLAVADTHERVVLANRRWSEAFVPGVKPVVGLSLAELEDKLGPAHGDTMSWWRAALTGKRVVRPWGEPGDTGPGREFEMLLAPLHDEEARVVGAYMSVRDVGEMRARQQEEARARRLETVGRLAGGVAHDFNNIVTGIQGYTHLLADSLPAGHEGHADLEEIRKAGDRAAALTRQLLAYARRQVIEPRSVDIAELINGFAGLLQRLIGEDVSLVLRHEPQLWRVRVDPGQLEQVIMNLAVNARDAMPVGGTLTIECGNVTLNDTEARRRDIEAGDYAVISVTDTGVGMTGEVLERLFEPFFTTKGPGKGTGLGLATVDGIVRQVGGAIAASSHVGVGTTFHVFFPRDLTTPAPTVAVVEAAPQPRGHEHILLVEDDDALRGLVARVLQSAGFTVSTFADGDAVLGADAAEFAKASMLLTDVVLPGLNGREIADRILRRAPHLRVLYVSGYTEDAVVRHGVLDGAVQFLAKPFSTDELVRKVRDVLDA